MVSFAKLFAAGAALIMAPAAVAHMIPQKPVVYGHPENGPLDRSGSNFPCQNVQYTINTMNEWKVGEQAMLSWVGGGSATHEGGSCQLSVTTDKTPSKTSQWKVIYSIEGGCPGTEGVGLDFPFTVPRELPNGQMSAAITWFNKIGNREFYMHCAPITVSGGTDSTDALSTLPDMALANIAVGTGTTCKTTENFDYIFDNPGPYHTRLGAGPFVPLCGGAVVSGQPGAPGTSAAPNDGHYTPPASLAPSQVPSAPTNPGVVTSFVHTLVTVTVTDPDPSDPSVQPTTPANSTPAPPPSLPSSAPAASTPVPQSSHALVLSSAPAVLASSSPRVPGPSPTPVSGCSPDGSIFCNGDTLFGICDHGRIVWQPVALGTACKNGVIARDYTHRNQRSIVKIMD